MQSWHGAVLLRQLLPEMTDCDAAQSCSNKAAIFSCSMLIAGLRSQRERCRALCPPRICQGVRVHNSAETLNPQDNRPGHPSMSASMMGLQTLTASLRPGGSGNSPAQSLQHQYAIAGRLAKTPQDMEPLPHATYRADQPSSTVHQVCSTSVLTCSHHACNALCGRPEDDGESGTTATGADMPGNGGSSTSCCRPRSFRRNASRPLTPPWRARWLHWPASMLSGNSPWSHDGSGTLLTAGGVGGV